MAVLNIRVEDRIRDQLKEMADAEGVTLSEYARDLLMAAVVPVHQSPERHGDLPAPDTMRTFDRQVSRCSRCCTASSRVYYPRTPTTLTGRRRIN
jgi:hypothetical protein